MPKKIVIIAYNDAQMLDIAGPMQVFASANDELNQLYYDITIASIDDGLVKTSAGLSMIAAPLSRVVPNDIDSLIVVGGQETAVQRACANRQLRIWLRSAAPGARRVCSVCTGTFVLATAGLLDGKRVATHWRGTKQLASYYPDLTVDKDAIYVEDGNVWTSAGVTTGIDMCLAMVKADCGVEIMTAIARTLVVYAHRPGTQSQFSPLLPVSPCKSAPLAATLDWLNENLKGPLTIKLCADHAGMSERTFYRKFIKSVGISPARHIETLRLNAARALVETSTAPLKTIAASAGFSGPQHLIAVFEKRLGLSPTDYRKLHGCTRPGG